MSAASLGYQDFIKEVFLQPIRSVLAIDDEYPTLDKLLGSSPEDLGNLPQGENWERLKRLTKFCRDQDRELLLDVHDGTHGNLAEDLPLKTLRQCDWVVLDYQLNGAGGDGQRCCQILRALADGEHFNLVSLYTQKPIQTVFREIIANFSAPLSIEELGAGNLDELIEDWEDEDPEIRQKLIESIEGSTYFRLKQEGYWEHPLTSKTELLSKFTSLWTEASPETKKKTTADNLLKAVGRAYEQEIGISGYVGPPISVHADFEATDKWICVGSLFISLVPKTEPPDQLLGHLLACLTAWNPPPNRLALAKLRAVSDAIGFKADSAIMEEKNVQAYWLKSLLESDDWERRDHIESLVNRQTELLMEHLRSAVVTFVKKTVDTASDETAKDLIVKFFGADADPSKGKIGHNAVVSNRSISGSNLIPGHIFQIPAEGESEIESWICLSPACDLIPFRNNARALKKKLGNWLPFTAVRLHHVTEKVAIKHASKGHVVFLKEGTSVSPYYSIFENGDSSKNPEWEEFFASDEGVLKLPEEPELRIARLNGIVAEEDRPSFKIVTTKIVGQLRAEYAANLTQKFTSHLSRIGLEYC